MSPNNRISFSRICISILFPLEILSLNFMIWFLEYSGVNKSFYVFHSSMKGTLDHTPLDILNWKIEYWISFVVFSHISVGLLILLIFQSWQRENRGWITASWVIFGMFLFLLVPIWGAFLRHL